MAYFLTPDTSIKADAVLCDKCAADKVPMREITDRFGTIRQQEGGWRWAPVYGRPCDDCRTPA